MNDVVRAWIRSRTLWLAGCALLLLAGLAVAGVRTRVDLAILSGAFGTAGGVLLWAVASRHMMQRQRAGLRVLVVRASVWMSGAVAAFVLLVMLGAPAFLLGSVPLAVSPYAFRVYGRCLRSIPTPSACQLSAWSGAIRYAGAEYVAFRPRPKSSTLTDEQLCTQWHDSYLALQGPVSPGQAIGIVQQRQRCLDELERRHPRGLTAWLASDAWASSSPLSYLTEKGSADAIFDWDQLTREQDW